MNFNPAVAWQVNKHLSIGAGVDYEKINSTLTSGVDYSAAIAGGVQQLAQAGHIGGSGPIAPGSECRIVRKHASQRYGRRVGLQPRALYTVNDVLRFGLAYRSEVHATIRDQWDSRRPLVANQVGQEIVEGPRLQAGRYPMGRCICR